jgi:hypothetical protein
MLSKQKIYVFLAAGILINLGAKNSFSTNKVKAVCVPMSDSHPLRYQYHKVEPIENENNEVCLDVKIGYRLQKNIHADQLAAMIFKDNPLEVSSSPTKTDRTFHGKAFALDENGQSRNNLSAKITNHYIELSADLSHKKETGFYLHFEMPIQRSINHLKLTTTNEVKSLTIPKGLAGTEFTATDDPKTTYFGSPRTPSTLLTAIGTAGKYLSGNIVGDMTKRKFAKAKWNVDNDAWNVADLLFQIGWNGWKRETSNIGFYGRAVIPTGTEIGKSWAEYTFSPVSGNGKHIELGIGANAHVDICDWDESSFKIDMDGFISYAFSKNQFRTFDLNTGSLTRYAMMKAFDSNLSYKEATVWGADATSQSIDVYIPFKGEFVINGIYNWKNHDVNIGYSIKGQQDEKTSSTLKAPKTYTYGNTAMGDVQSPGTVGSFTQSQITPHSNMNKGSLSDVTKYDSKDAYTYYGKTINTTTKLNGDMINLRSGLMDAQILSIIFAGYAYTFDHEYSPQLGINGSFGISPQSYYTPEMWDLGIFLKAVF